MKLPGRFCFVFVSPVVLAFLTGCGESGKGIQISYQRPAEFQIPEKIRRVAVAEFGAKTAEERQWGEIAADCLTSALDAYNKKYNRYQLYERKRLKEILGEQQLQMAISDSASAMKMGKIADVQAMIWGNVSVVHRDEQATRTAFDPLRRTTKTVTYTKRYCMAAVSFVMDDVTTGKTLAAVQVTREYDSESDSKKSGGAKIGKMLGFGGSDLPPSEQVLRKLIEQCVEVFLSKVSPHDVVFEVKLEKGKSETVKDGNQFAETKAFADALKLYEQAIRDHGDDHGAMFNAGVMCEALGRLNEAGEYYQKALALKVNKKYIEANQRVKKESTGE
ncbi:MAG TPA: CsgG/HfaB family protein [Phycisphaerae bacterium]|nr:CsgG/HfaB family protein [Phycisphaerae bacterium]